MDEFLERVRVCVDGWLPMRTADSTLWTTPAGQLVQAPHQQQALPPLEPGARLVDPDELHAFEARLLEAPTDA